MRSSATRWAPSIALALCVDSRAALINHSDDQLAVAHDYVEFAADGEAQLLQPAAAQAQRGDALVAVGVVAVADGAALRARGHAGGLGGAACRDRAGARGWGCAPGSAAA